MAGTVSRSHRGAILGSLLLLTLLGSGCAGEASIEERALPSLVLQEADVPQLQLFDEGPQARGDLPSGDRGDPERYGRKGGWKARFRLPSASSESRGPLVVESRADLFGDANGAEKDLQAARGDLADTWTDVETPKIGDAVWAATTVQESAAASIRHYAITWREANVVAALLVQGFDGQLTLGNVLALARAQQKRIDAQTA